jgi:hypothetical protein
MPEEPPGAGQHGEGTAKDPVRVLVTAIGTLPEADRDLVYTWLLRRGFRAAEAGMVAVPGRPRRAQVATVLEQYLEPASGLSLTQPSGQQMVPVRFPTEQHAQLRRWCGEHGFSMATVIRGLVSRFLEGQLPEADQPV